jgi:hypothetical protein
MRVMKLERAIAPVLAVLLSGIACLAVCAFGCRAEASGPPAMRACCSRSAAIDAEESCARGPASSHMEGVPSLETCCFFAGRADARLTPPRDDGAGGAVAPERARIVLVPAAAGVRIAFTSAGPPRDRGDTHLRCCVFLI